MGSAEGRAGRGGGGRGGLVSIRWSQAFTNVHEWGQSLFYSIRWILFLSIETSNHLTFVCSVLRLDYPCSGMLSMSAQSLISDSQITSVQSGDRNWMPENIRLVTSRSGWALPQPPPVRE